MCYTKREILFQPRDRKGGSTVIPFFTDLFRAEQEVREYWQKERWRQTRNIAILSIALFLMMSVMNLYQRSYGMLLTTLTGAIALFVCLLVGRRRQNTLPVELVCFVLLLVLFTGYILLGGQRRLCRTVGGGRSADVYDAAECEAGDTYQRVFSPAAVPHLLRPPG